MNGMEFLPRDDVTRIKARLAHPVIDADGHAIEYLPLVRDILREQAGDDAVAVMDLVTNGGSAVRGLSPEQRRAAGLIRTSWWGLPTRNTLDRSTALLPDLLAARLPELGIDHAVLYPTYGLVPAALDDASIRRRAPHGGSTRSASIRSTTTTRSGSAAWSSACRPRSTPPRWDGRCAPR